MTHLELTYLLKMVMFQYVYQRVSSHSPMYRSLICSRMLLSVPTVCQAARGGLVGRGNSSAEMLWSKLNQAFLRATIKNGEKRW